MDVIRCTVIDEKGAVSFIAHADVLPALVAACANNPSSVEELLDGAENYYRNLKDYVLSGLAVFDEQNTPESREAIRAALRSLPPHQQPVFRVVDEDTQEASLRPVKAGAVVFNLRAKRIIQIVNTYREIKRSGYARVFDGEGFTRRVFRYRLPEEWALVP
ncbi:hypothetical protein HRbin25_00685 [bacterium HR25]|jgi:hypothetical protein|nr:hypothetical protein HRbin25_00685 [bacterium HR25]